jgi:anti-sigma factor RsiW
VKCSLLTLSTFIDGELAPQRRAEVDAHLVGCSRCSAGAATLREEKSRIGQLARVRVDPASTQLMLEQVGIAIDPAADLSPVPVPVPPPPPAPPDEHRPWQSGTSSPALPWTPHRPDPAPAVRASEEIIAPPATPEVQPDLPLDGVRSVPQSWNRVADDPPAPAHVEDAATVPESSASEDTRLAGADEEWLGGAGVPESWDADLPPPSDATTPPATPSTASTPPPADEPMAPPPPPPQTAPDPPLRVPPPTRLASASGPGALWTRIHDAVTVRLALARGGDALEDSVQIVSGAPTRRGAQLPAPEPEPDPASTSGIVAGSPTPQIPAQLAPPPDVELNGVGGMEHAPEATVDVPTVPPAVDEAVDRRYRVPVEATDERDSAEPVDTAGWNAFAASSYPELDMPADQPVEQKPPRPLGRHSRAVAREHAPLSTRVGRATAAASTAVARVRQGVGRIASTGPDNRLLAGIAGIGLIFVVALLIGHATSHPATPTAAKPAPATSAPQQHQSVPPQPSAATGTSVAPAPSQVQTYGAGNTGFQVIRLRYGVGAAYSRVVFDLGAASGSAVGTPKVTVSFTNPTTMLVTFNGTVPAGSTGSPTPGKVISSVSLVSSSGGKTVYRFGLTRAATTTAFYLASPTRFVLDLH